MEACYFPETLRDANGLAGTAELRLYLMQLVCPKPRRAKAQQVEMV